MVLCLLVDIFISHMIVSANVQDDSKHRVWKAFIEKNNENWRIEELIFSLISALVS